VLDLIVPSSWCFAPSFLMNRSTFPMFQSPRTLNRCLIFKVRHRFLFEAA